MVAAGTPKVGPGGAPGDPNEVRPFSPNAFVSVPVLIGAAAGLPSTSLRPSRGGGGGRVSQLFSKRPLAEE